MTRYRLAGAIWGPALFVAAWVVGGLLVEGYSPVEDHISRLAGVTAPTFVLMSAGFAAFGVGVGAAAWPLRRIIGLPAATSVGVSAVGTIGVMLTPVGWSPDTDLLHSVFALLTYASLALAGPLAALALFRRHPVWAIASLGAGVLTFVALSYDSTTPGLFQRIGLTTADVWLMAVGFAAVTGRLRGNEAG